MISRKKMIQFGLMLVLGVASAFAGGDGWLTDYAKALAKAKETNKPILLDFTGSDWCGWCVKLNKEVFSKAEFKAFAAENLVLVEVDFPNAKQQSAEVKKQNNELQRKYGIQGYPTLILLSPEEKVLGKLGYMPGGPKVMIEEIKKLIK